MTGNKDCKNTSHAMHLCSLKACGLGEPGDDVFAKLIDKPQFMCETCKDKSNKAENHCKPKKIQP